MDNEKMEKNLKPFVVTVVKLVEIIFGKQLGVSLVSSGKIEIITHYTEFKLFEKHFHV